MKICNAIEECDHPVRKRGLCNKHYQRWRRHGDTTALVVRHEGGPEDRFWAKVDKHGPISSLLSSRCWIWKAKMNRGYGQLRVGGKNVYVHVFAYKLLVGPVQDGMQVDHRCFNGACVNPDHLRAVTIKQNVENYRGLRTDNTSGVRGVTWSGTKWRATVTHWGRNYHVGYFDSINDAKRAVIAKRNELHTHNDVDRLA